MIFQKEIARVAEQSGVTKAVIGKDWVLGHFLAAMYAIPEMRDNLVFKGGGPVCGNAGFPITDSPKTLISPLGRRISS